MLKIKDVHNLKQVYHYQITFSVPYFFQQDYAVWEKSFAEDIDGEGRRLFRELSVKAAYEDEKIVGFIQYGHSALGFDDRGEISAEVSYPIIRNLYFDPDRPDAGELLLTEALAALGPADTVYAFFHYFGMSCFARHGKLFEKHGHIEALLKDHGFEIEHENVYYSSVLDGCEDVDIQIAPQNLTKGNQQYMDFLSAGHQVGGCEVHFLDKKTAYLRWIYVNGDLTGKGVGTQCMEALKQWLYGQGITRFDTDTALGNLVARHFYEKNDFAREGITRSYFRKEKRYGGI